MNVQTSNLIDLNDVPLHLLPLYSLVTQPRWLVLLLLLLIAAVIDVRTMRIPNWLTFGGAALALGWSAAVTGTDPGWGAALGGLGIGLLLTLPLHVFGGLGAGDVKLMAMTGAFLGPLGAAYSVLFTVMLGGVFALLFSAARGRLRRLFVNVGAAATNAVLQAASGAIARPAIVRPAVSAGVSAGRLPYALCVCGGTFTYLWLAQLGHV